MSYTDMLQAHLQHIVELVHDLSMSLFPLVPTTIDFALTTTFHYIFSSSSYYNHLIAYHKFCFHTFSLYLPL
jgi:hypothetical protein